MRPGVRPDLLLPPEAVAASFKFCDLAKPVLGAGRKKPSVFQPEQREAPALTSRGFFVGGPFVEPHFSHHPSADRFASPRSLRF